MSDTATEALVVHHLEEVGAIFERILKAHGCFERVLGEVESKRSCVENTGIPYPSPGDIGLDPKALVEWYQRRYGRLTTSLEAFAVKSGLGSGAELLSEFVALYLMDRDAPAAGAEGRRSPASAGHSDPALSSRVAKREHPPENRR